MARRLAPECDYNTCTMMFLLLLLIVEQSGLKYSSGHVGFGAMTKLAHVISASAVDIYMSNGQEIE